MWGVVLAWQHCGNDFLHSLIFFYFFFLEYIFWAPAKPAIWGEVVFRVKSGCSFFPWGCVIKFFLRLKENLFFLFGRRENKPFEVSLVFFFFLKKKKCTEGFQIVYFEKIRVFKAGKTKKREGKKIFFFFLSFFLPFEYSSMG